MNAFPHHWETIPLDIIMFLHFRPIAINIVYTVSNRVNKSSTSVTLVKIIWEGEENCEDNLQYFILEVFVHYCTEMEVGRPYYGDFGNILAAPEYFVNSHQKSAGCCNTQQLYENLYRQLSSPNNGRILFRNGHCRGSKAQYPQYKNQIRLFGWRYRLGGRLQNPWWTLSHCVLSENGFMTKEKECCWLQTEDAL